MHDDPGLYDPCPDDGGPDDHTPCDAAVAPVGGYRIRSDDTWALAREAYLAGETAEAVCARFSLGLSVFRDRARRGGWRRCDQADPGPMPVGPEDDIDFDAGYGELAAHALRQLRRTMARGRVSAAAGWMRLHDRLIARAEQEARQAVVHPPRSVQEVRLREWMEARRQEAAAAVAARAGTPSQGLTGVDLANSIATRTADLARRMGRADPRDSAGRAALQAELLRLNAEVRGRSAPDPDDPDDPDPFSTDGIWSDPP